jgi:hypothetical protein
MWGSLHRAVQEKMSRVLGKLRWAALWPDRMGWASFAYPPFFPDITSSFLAEFFQGKIREVSWEYLKTGFKT